MTAAHTPGPWFARKDPNALDNDDWCVGTGPENIDKVAVCSAWDAHLIAAAPELLEALGLIANTGMDARQCMVTARAAISKATGAQP